MKRMNSTSFFFKVWKTENFRKLLTKEEEEEVQRDSEINVEKLLVKVVSVVQMQIKVLLL